MGTALSVTPCAASLRCKTTETAPESQQAPTFTNPHQQHNLNHDIPV